jgi:hypothetical protein
MVDVVSSTSTSQTASSCANGDEVSARGAEDSCALDLKAAKHSVGVPGCPPRGLLLKLASC